MEKYITSIKDLVFRAMTNMAEIKAEADKGDAKACFQLGMIYLLGINTKVNFPLAEKFFGNPCLAEDPNAIRMIGFINELEKDFSSAFQHYAEASEKDTKSYEDGKIDYLTYKYSEYIDEVLAARHELQSFFNELGLLPNQALNGIITNIVNAYLQGGNSKTEAIIKMAYICGDEPTCYQAAEEMYELKDYISASKWINMGNVSNDKFLRTSIAEKFSESKRLLETMNYVSTKEKIIDTILHDYFGKHIFILASLVQKQKGHYRELFEDIRRKGYLRIRVDAQIMEITQGMKVDRYKLHDIEAIIDELQITGKEEERIKKSIDIAAKQGNGCIYILEKNIDASPKSFAVLEIVEIEGNSLLANQWVDSLADIKEQVISKANEQRGQWQLNVKQEIDKLIAEKKLEDEKQHQKEIQQKKQIRVRIYKTIVCAIIIAISIPIIKTVVGWHLPEFLSMLICMVPIFFMFYISAKIFNWNWSDF